MICDVQFGLDGVQHVKHACQLMLGQQSNMQIQNRATFRFLAHAILTDEDECRKKDRFQRNNHRQEPVGERVKGVHTEPSGVNQDPQPKPDYVHVGETMRPEKDVMVSATRPCKPRSRAALARSLMMVRMFRSITLLRAGLSSCGPGCFASFGCICQLYLCQGCCVRVWQPNSNGPAAAAARKLSPSPVGRGIWGEVLQARGSGFEPLLADPEFGVSTSTVYNVDLRLCGAESTGKSVYCEYLFSGVFSHLQLICNRDRKWMREGDSIAFAILQASGTVGGG